MGPKFEQHSVVEVENDACKEGLEPKSNNAGRNADSKLTNLNNNLIIIGQPRAHSLRVRLSPERKEEFPQTRSGVVPPCLRV